MTPNQTIDVEAERAAFITAYRRWCYDSHPDGHPEMVLSMAESHWGRAAGAMWLAAKRSIPVPAYTGTIDSDEFKFLAEFWSGKYHSAIREIRLGTGEAWSALIAHIDARLNAERQEGRRDAHETNIALVNQICDLSERLERRTPVSGEVAEE